MLKHLLTVLAFMIVTFGVQGLSHFVINKAHFASIGFARENPIMPLGFAVMIIQGFILSFAMTYVGPNPVTLWSGIILSLTFGLFLGSYIALAEPAKYAAPSVLAWVRVEALASFTQFTIFGALLALIHQRFG